MENKHIIRTNRYGDFATLIGRILIGGIFLIFGIKEILNFSITSNYIASVGFPIAGFFAVIAILIEVILGFSIILGYYTKISAGILIVFMIIITPAFHNPIYADQLPFFLENLMIIGGLLFISSFGAGRISLDHKILKFY